MHFLFYMFCLLGCMWGAVLVYIIILFGRKFPNCMPDKAQRKLTVVIKSPKKMYV